MDQMSAHLERGWDLAQRGDTHGAASSARRALELNPNSPEVHNLLGFVAALDGDCDEAIEAYQQAICLDDGYVEAMLNAAELFVHPMAQFEDAIDICDQILVGDRAVDTTALGGRTHDDDVFNCGEISHERSYQWSEIRVNENGFVFCVVDDVFELTWEEPNIERVADTPRVGGCPIELVMAMIVPRERSNGVSDVGPEFLRKCSSEFPNAYVERVIEIDPARMLGGLHQHGTPPVLLLPVPTSLLARAANST